MQEDLLKKIKNNFEFVVLESYTKDIQHVLDHFGAGKLVELSLVYCLKIDKSFVPLGTVKTSQGNFVFLEIPVIMPNASKVLAMITKKLELKNPIFTQTDKAKITFAHIEDSYFALCSYEM